MPLLSDPWLRLSVPCRSRVPYQHFHHSHELGPTQGIDPPTFFCFHTDRPSAAVVVGVVLPSRYSDGLLDGRLRFDFRYGQDVSLVSNIPV
jgi:hypothetical protein